jgi:hypothetical protein
VIDSCKFRDKVFAYANSIATVRKGIPISRLQDSLNHNALGIGWDEVDKVLKRHL